MWNSHNQIKLDAAETDDHWNEIGGPIETDAGQGLIDQQSEDHAENDDGQYHQERVLGCKPKASPKILVVNKIGVVFQANEFWSP